MHLIKNIMTQEQIAICYAMKQIQELYMNVLHPNMSYDNRIQCLRDLKVYWFQVGSRFYGWVT